ncbi:MAG: methyltransferase [Candidatus Binatia bacterium]
MDGPAASAPARGQLGEGAPPLVERVIECGDLRVPLLCATALERFVDVEALLRDEDQPEPPYWLHLWPGALALARRVAGDPTVRPGLDVLELGCGLGLPALAAARRGARVVASDHLRAPLSVLAGSARANRCALARVQMDWRAPALCGRFHLCLGAEIGYDPAAEPAIVAALSACLRPDGLAWLADSVNTTRQTVLALLERSGFTVRTEQVREHEDGRPVWVRLIEARRT